MPLQKISKELSIKTIQKWFQVFVIYSKVARAQVLVMPALIIACAYMYSQYHYHMFNRTSFIFVAISILFFNLSVNTISEYRDCQKGIDDIHSSETKYRLVSGIVPKKNVLYIGIVAFGIATICGIIASLLKPVSLLLPGVLGASIAWFYSERPLGLKYKAYGEICVFIVYGILICSSCILSLIHTIHVEDILFGIPFGLLTTNVVLANNIRDYTFELGKTKTLVTKFGLKFAYSLLFITTHMAYLFIPILIYYNILPNTSYIALFSYCLVFALIYKLNSPKFINIFGIMQVLFCILTIVALVIH